MLSEFATIFNSKNPDVIQMQNAFSMMPVLEERLEINEIKCDLNRWDNTKLKYKGGKTFYSFGKVRYQHYSIRLKGRLLVDTNTAVGEECDIDGIMELSSLTGALFQKLASRSFGAAFQNALVREMIKDDLLVPFKDKPVDQPLSMFELLKADRAGHTFDPKQGFLKDVAEIDFTSMFPWLIYNHNIGADNLFCDQEPLVDVPGLPLRISTAKKGLIQRAIKPMLDKRMHYKKNPTALNRQKAAALKWMLVTCYGYLRFREFKLGVATSHMAICAYARETILQAARTAEEQGFEVLHGIVDSLYLRKKGMDEEEVRKLCMLLEKETNIPVSFEGIFNWIVFLPSINDPNRPVPAKYFGILKNGDIKARGIEVRQRSAPQITRVYQKKCLEIISKTRSKKEVREKLPEMCNLLKKIMSEISHADSEILEHNIYIGRIDYKHNIAQKKIVQSMIRKGQNPLPGQKISYIMQQGNKPVLSEDYKSPDKAHYKKLLVRSLYTLMLPFGIRREEIILQSDLEKQLKITDFLSSIKIKYVPASSKKMSAQAINTNRSGLSEKTLRHELERQGWTVWRGSLINILRRDDLYPNVQRKYMKLHELLSKFHPDKTEELKYLCDVHHGIPDFIAFRNGQFKFVECKLEHEQLSKRQKTCIKRLRNMGFLVEVHKLVGHETKTRSADLYLELGQKIVTEKQRSF